MVDQLRRLPTLAKVGAFIIAIFSAMALFAPWLAPHDPYESSVNVFQLPSVSYWLGTDQLGRDVLSGVIYGARASLLIGVGAGMLAVLVGVPVGLSAAYFRGPWDRFVVWLIDVIISMPIVVLALVITTAVGATHLSILFVLGMVTWPSVARLVRGQGLAVCEMAYVEASRAVGGSDWWIIHRHLFPNVARVVAAQFAVVTSIAIFASASLSFLGVGLPAPTIDWGGSVRAGFDYLTVNPAISLGPGAAVSFAIAGFYFLGSSVR